MSTKYYFTRKGLEKLRTQIANLEKKLRDLQSQSAYVAEVGGDQWHDNASYEHLVIDLRGIDKRLNDAHDCLNQAIIVDPPTRFDQVSIGTRVKIVRDGMEVEWNIVGFGESDSTMNMIAYNTPLASLIMGKRKGEVIIGKIAGREVEIEIIDIAKGGDGDVCSS